MVRLRGSTCAFGFEAIFLGSVTACGTGSVCPTLSTTKVLMKMTITKERRVRIGARPRHKQKTECSKEIFVGTAAPGCPAAKRRKPLHTLSLRALMHLHCAPGLVPGMTNILERAFGAFRLAREAQLPTVPDDLVREQNP